MRPALYIVELTGNEARAIAQGLHVLAQDDKGYAARSTLESLRMQLPNIKHNPAFHNVYPNKLVAPSGAIEIESICYLPIV